MKLIDVFIVPAAIFFALMVSGLVESNLIGATAPANGKRCGSFWGYNNATCPGGIDPATGLRLCVNRAAGGGSCQMSEDAYAICEPAYWSSSNCTAGTPYSYECVGKFSGGVCGASPSQLWVSGPQCDTPTEGCNQF